MITTVDAPLSFAHLGALEIGPPHLIDLMAGAGFASTGLRTRRVGPGSPEYPLDDPALRRAMKERIAATGVTVLHIELVALERTLDVRELRAMFDTGAEIGATRIAATGDDEAFEIVATKLAEVCELARPHGFSVDLEFMPYRAVRSLDDAIKVVTMARQPNAHVLLDALHFFRSSSSLAQLKAIDPALIGTVQICDAPAAAPADLVYEARNARLLPDQGALALDAFMDAIPGNPPLGVEVPLATAFPDLGALERARLTVEATRKCLARRAQR